jgi:hypothetical protein
MSRSFDTGCVTCDELASRIDDAIRQMNSEVRNSPEHQRVLRDVSSLLLRIEQHQQQHAGDTLAA